MHIPQTLGKFDKHKISDDKIKTLNIGFDYAIERNPKQFINKFIIETENAIRHLDITFRYLATKKIILPSQINVTHCINTSIQSKSKTILEQNNLSRAKPDKGRTIVIIHKETFKKDRPLHTTG
jgi:hypothetical protein